MLLSNRASTSVALSNEPHESLKRRLMHVLLCADICVTVTLFDGLVLARSQFNTDMVWF